MDHVQEKVIIKGIKSQCHTPQQVTRGQGGYMSSEFIGLKWNRPGVEVLADIYELTSIWGQKTCIRCA